jgi:CDP-diacylglycerol--glycerol-3-phosphate 3-phosphatidyltransferase
MLLSNKITTLRIVLVIPFVAFLLQESILFKVAALIVFIVASLSDWLDGAIARKRNEVTILGKFLDPLADKLFISSAFIVFIQLNELTVDAWPVILIISREFIINGLRTVAASQGKIIAASSIGKFKTTLQLVAIFLILIILIVQRFEYMANYFVILTSLITLYSGCSYLRKNREILKTG